ncbi:MAG TPA: hypothetical protein DCR97_14030 [Deltaproteobacteria bacterium]|nr:hypothetical protein [Deltaproteobacteria bacterium]
MAWNECGGEKLFRIMAIIHNNINTGTKGSQKTIDCLKDRHKVQIFQGAGQIQLKFATGHKDSINLRPNIEDSDAYALGSIF